LEPCRRTHDVILGIKSPRRDPWYRVWLSRCFNLLLRLVFGVPYHDMDTGFRLIRREALEEIAPDIRYLSFFTAEFVVRAHYAGYHIVEVPVHHYARKIGSTTIFFISSLFLISLQQVVGIVRMYREFRKDGLIPPRAAKSAASDESHGQ
jgi:GT2 family glycosyltransferase